MISRISAMIIATNDVEILVFGPNESGKYSATIAHSKEHRSHPCMPIISSDCAYDTADAAKSSIETTIKEIKEYFANEQNHTIG